MLKHGQAMADGLDGSFLVATASGLMEVGPTTPNGPWTARPYGVGGRRIRGIFRHGGELWFGCDQRLCVEERGQIHEYGDAAGLPADSWDAVAVTPDGTVWARSPNKLYRRSSGTAKFEKENFALASSMYWGTLEVGPGGDLLVATDKGVAVHSRGGWSVIDESKGLRASMTAAVLVDREGSLWIGSVGAGLARRLGTGEWESWTKAEGLPSNLIWNIRRDARGSLWVGTGEGLARLPGALPGRTWTTKDGLGGDNVRWLGETSDGAIWSITKPGWLSRIDPVSGRVRQVGKEDGLDAETPNRGLVDHAGRLWVAANTGIFRCDAPGSSVRFAKVSPPDVVVKAPGP